MSVWESAAGETPGRKRPVLTGRGRRKAWKVLAGAAVFATIFAMGRIQSRAAEEYAYTVTFYPGNHGTFQGAGELSVNEKNASDELIPVQNDGSWQIEQNGEYIRVTGLKAGQYVVFGDVNEAVQLETGSRYYVKGIRVSGRDNSTVDIPAFPVEGDRDYVVAYGIQGDLTSYVVNYQDAGGNTLAPSRTYYGNVGDKPVVAFRYIEGYQPQAYNLTKTLSQNTAENVFTFTYRRVPTASSGGGTGTGTGGNEAGSGGTGAGTPGAGEGTGGAGTAGTGAGAGTPGAGTAVVTPGGQGGAQQPENPDENQEGDVQTPDNAGGNQEGDAQNPEENLPDENVPQDVVDLDEGEVPLAGPEGSEDGSFRFPVWGSICIAVAGAAAVGLVLWFMIVHRKKEKAEKAEK